jgi:hypothetical protein
MKIAFAFVFMMVFYAGLSTTKSVAEVEAEFDQLVNITITANIKNVINELVARIRASINPYQECYKVARNMSIIKLNQLENEGKVLKNKISYLFLEGTQSLEMAFAENVLKSEYGSLLTSCLLPMIDSLILHKSQIKTKLSKHPADFKCWNEYKENNEKRCNLLAEAILNETKVIRDIDEKLEPELALFNNMFDKYIAAVMAECSAKYPKCYVDFVIFH